MSAKLYHKTFPGKLEQSFRVLLVLQNKSEQKNTDGCQCTYVNGKVQTEMGKGIIIDIVAMLNMSVLSMVLSVSVRCKYERKDL